MAGFLTCLTIVLTLETLRQDITAFYQVVSYDTSLLRFIRTLMCAAVAVSVAGVRFSLRHSLLPLALFTAVIADYFLILENNLKLGIGIFAIMQIVLVARHLHGFYAGIISKKPFQIAVVLGLLILALGNVLLWQALQPKGLAIPVLIYSSLLIVSAITAYSTRYNPNFSKTTSRLAFFGMVLFVLCDITVGVGAAFGQTRVGQLVRASTGLFYTPSLLMLAWSGFLPKKD